MARNPNAVWDPLPSSSGGAFTGGPKKGVAHKTQGATYRGARGTYVTRSLGPHFTISEDAVLYEHLDTDEASSAVANDSGGVQTNRDGAIQVEIVGFSGQTATAEQIAVFVSLQVWLEEAEGIPRTWPMGRPPVDSQSGYGENNGHRDPAVWEATAGWYAHSQVPENEHWDPAWTDEEWEAITREEDDDMLTPEQEQALNNINAATAITLDVLGRLDQWRYSEQQDGDEPVDVNALASALAPLLESQVVAVSDTDLNRIAQRVQDEQDRRERERLEPPQ